MSRRGVRTIFMCTEEKLQFVAPSSGFGFSRGTSEVGVMPNIH